MLNLDKVQILYHNLCHMYYNWYGTLKVPATIQVFINYISIVILDS